jgi:hypothetical protein
VLEAARTEAGRFLWLDGVVRLNEALARTERFYRGNTGNKIAMGLQARIATLR